MVFRFFNSIVAPFRVIAHSTSYILFRDSGLVELKLRQPNHFENRYLFLALSPNDVCADVEVDIESI